MKQEGDMPGQEDGWRKNTQWHRSVSINSAASMTYQRRRGRIVKAWLPAHPGPTYDSKHLSCYSFISETEYHGHSYHPRIVLWLSLLHTLSNRTLHTRVSGFNRLLKRQCWKWGIGLNSLEFLLIALNVYSGYTIAYYRTCKFATIWQYPMSSSLCICLFMCMELYEHVCESQRTFLVCYFCFWGFVCFALFLFVCFWENVSYWHGADQVDLA